MPTKTKTKEKKETTRDEAGVSEAEAAMYDEIASMMTQPPGERERDEPTQLFDSKNEGHKNTIEEFDDSRPAGDEQGEPDTPQPDAPEPESGTDEPADTPEDGKEEGEQQTDELTEVERLKERSDRLLVVLDGNIKLPPLADEPSGEMAAQAKEDEKPLVAPSFQDIDGASIVGKITDEELFDAQNDIAAQRKLLEKVAGNAAAAAVQTSRLGTRSEIEGYHKANQIVEDYMGLEHNMDLRPLRQTVVERGAEIQERNKDMKPSEALDMAGDQVRQHLQMPIPEKTNSKGGPQTIKKIRGAANAVTPMKPIHAGRTGARRTGGGAKPEEEMSEFDRTIDEIHAAGQRNRLGSMR